MAGWSRRMAAAAGIAVLAAGSLCVLLVVSRQFVQPERDVLLQVDTVRANMVAMGKELEREGAKIAGAKLIREASELSKGKSKSTLKAHKLHQQSAGAPAWATGAPFKQGKNGKVYDAPHIGGTNGVFMGSNGGGNGWVRKLPKKLQHKRQSLRSRRPAMRSPLARNRALLYPAPRFGVHRRPMYGMREHYREAPTFGKMNYMHPVSMPPRPAQTLGGSDFDPDEGEDAEDFDWSDEDLDDDGADEEEPEFEEPESEGYPGEHVQVATGYPAAYDGRWGGQFYRNAGGHEEAMRKAGVNFDDYPTDVYRGLPYFLYDPSATKQKEQNQKIRAGKHLDEPYTQTAGANEGGEDMAAGWGTWNEGGAAEDHVRQAGVKIDKDPLHLRSGFPNPAWDSTEFDQQRHVPKMPPKDAWEAVQNHRKSQDALESKGVIVNHFPMDKPEKTVYNQVDGLMDTLVHTDETPMYRDTGVAAQEKPMHFLLDDNVNGESETQADALSKVFVSGKLDQVRQNEEVPEQGIELHPDETLPWPPAEEEGTPDEEEENEGDGEGDDWNGDWDESGEYKSGPQPALWQGVRLPLPRRQAVLFD